MRAWILLIVVAAVALGVFVAFGRETSPDRSAAPLPPSTSAQEMTSPSQQAVSALSPAHASPVVSSPPPPDAFVLRAVERCNADTHNNPRRKSCLLLRNAAVFPDGSVQYCAEDNSGEDPELASGHFPPRGASDRYFLRAARLLRVPREKLEAQTTTAGRRTHIALFTHNYIGAAFDNVWHTLSDFAVCMFDTVVPLMPKAAADSQSLEQQRAPVTWLTFPPAFSNYRDRSPCATEKVCRGKVLFELFIKIFAHVHFILSDVSSPASAPAADTASLPVRYPFLIVGSATACSPVRTEGVGTPRCVAALRLFRDHMLRQYALDPTVRSALAVATSDAGKAASKCPIHVHLMSRQKAFYRKMHPWPEIVASVERVVASEKTKNKCAAGAAESIKLDVVDLDHKTDFGTQLRSVATTDVFIAGRGGGTGLCIFLPLNATYISVSLSDRWNPHRDLVPPWLRLRHLEAQAVHHTDPRRGPQLSKGRVDANKCDYKLDPAKLAEEVQLALRGY